MSPSNTDITYFDKFNYTINAKEVNLRQLFNYSFVKINSLSTKDLKSFNEQRVIKRINCRVFICKKVYGFYYLPNLPEAETIICYKTGLKKVGCMTKVRGLFCISNKVKVLQKSLPLVEILHCQDNRINFLPEDLPKAKEVNCSKNNITQLPYLPQCEVLDCSDNNIAFLPYLPKCRKIKLDNNPIIYYSCDYSKKMEIPYPSPLEKIIDDYLLAKLFLTGLNNNLGIDNSISLLWQEHFITEENFINHVYKVFNSLGRNCIHNKLVNFIRFHQLIKNN